MNTRELNYYHLPKASITLAALDHTNEKRGNSVARSLFSVMRYLWETDCVDVQDTCMRTLAEGWVDKENWEGLSSEYCKHVEENHELAQRTIIALASYPDPAYVKIAIKIAKLYLEFALEAASNDSLKHYHRHEMSGPLASEKWSPRVLRFVLRLFVQRTHSVLGYIQSNSLFLAPELAKCLLYVITCGKVTEFDAHLILTTYTWHMQRILESGKSHEMYEQGWGKYERLFEHAVATRGRYMNARVRSRLHKMACLIRDEIKFERHTTLGDVLAARAKHVVGVFLQTPLVPLDPQ